MEVEIKKEDSTLDVGDVFVINNIPYLLLVSDYPGVERPYQLISFCGSYMFFSAESLEQVKQYLIEAGWVDGKITNVVHYPSSEYKLVLERKEVKN